MKLLTSRRLIFECIFFVVASTGCIKKPADLATLSPSQSPTATSTSLPPTATRTRTPIPPTSTPTATRTPRPTRTPAPTFTPFPYSELPGRLAYVSFECPGPGICTDLWVMRPDLSETMDVTNNDHALVLHPKWSPDSRYIAYEYATLGENGLYQLAVYDFLKNEKVVLTPNGIKTLAGLSWSPDARFLAYGEVDQDGTNGDIYRIDVQSRRLTNLTLQFADWAEYPSWSPDGEWIAFAARRASSDDSASAIWVMKPDGSAPQRLISDGAQSWDDIKPSWSPDGAQIAFYRRAITPGDRGINGLWSVGADGEGGQLLYYFSDDPILSDAPAWSPNGNYIAMNHGNETQTDVWLVWADGAQAINISQASGQNVGASWSPDSRALVFSLNSPGSQIFLFVIDTPIPFLVPGPTGILDANWSPQD